jgi:hypothetical protein
MYQLGRDFCLAKHILFNWPCGLMDKALVFGTKDCRLESCQGHFPETIALGFAKHE